MNIMTYKHKLLILLNLLPFLVMAQFSASKNQSKPFSKGLGAADYHFEIGTQAGFSSNKSSFYTTYFSPSATFDITKKFSIVAGVGASFTQLNNATVLNYDMSTSKTDATISSVYSYASGIYQVNSKMNIYGGILVEQVYSNPQGNYAPMNNRYKDVNLGINYNVNRHISFNAQIQFSDRPHSYYNSFQQTNGLNGFQGYSGFSPFY
jgi:hypothetical protein